ncbi:hypothetical protein WH50_22715 [Pokkaliibacter plantistimulans]|uniref:DUF2937 family protein n=1 Tax=Pokkaliibacter plantistimulans TaxID=1635171 RepID=A0ABX5LUB5_9GAMM|nr:DUF2937 family protein [Pokkaliibacter plantistimulans]PXF29093.1 hypothetical protein WH50_22715 [Pokkaliibacter plantistimulans]
MFRDYLRLMVFAVGLLLGVQVPGLIDQYQKRVDAHLQEAGQNLQAFQLTADKYFKGDLQALIQHYADSDDPVFQADSVSVRAVYQRYQVFTAEQRALQQPWYGVTWHMLVAANRSLLQETLNQYSYTVPLTPSAIGWGVAVGFLASFLIELFVLLLARIVGIGPFSRRAGQL